jgi:outer membrane lipoprotein-sorting protein
MKILARVLLAIHLVVFTAVISFAQPTAEEIIKRAEDLMRGRSNTGTLSMTITTPNWERTLTMDYWEKGKDKSLIKITSPAKEAGMVSLKVDNNMWNYLPGVERVIKVPPSMMMQSWMGSDFTNDDLVKESSIVDDYDPAISGSDTLDGDEVYLLELIPKPEAAVVWGKIVAYIRARDYIPVKYEYYDEKEELIRVMNLSEVKWMGDRNIPTVWTIIPLKKEGRKTVMEVIELQFDIPIDDDIFSLSNLKRGVTP